MQIGVSIPGRRGGKMVATKLGLKVFDGGAHSGLADEICQYLNIRKGNMELSCYQDGEVSVRVDESVRGADVFVIQPTCRPVNHNLVSLLIILDALKRASVSRVTAVVSYYGYARQEKKTQGREPISAKLVANLLREAGADRILTIDLHTWAIMGFFDIPVDMASAIPLLSEYFLKLGITDPVAVSPDAGGVGRARFFAKKLGTSLAFIDKRRPRPNEAQVMHVVGDIKGRDAILIDDIVDTAGTMVEAVQALKEKGARRVFGCVTHPVLSGSALQRIENSVMEKLIVTNTMPLAPEAEKSERIVVLSVAPLLGEIISRIHRNQSVSELFT